MGRMLKARVRTLEPHVRRKLVAEEIQFGDKERAEEALIKCVSGEALVQAYKQLLEGDGK
jgi:hypothetical protein